MWVYTGECDINGDWVDSFIEELDEVTDYHKREGKDIEPYDCFYEALNQWVDREFAYYTSQDKFVSEVGLNNCVSLIKEGEEGSLRNVDTGLNFCYLVCESAFKQCISWEDDEIEESIRSRRNRNYKPVRESLRKPSYRTRRTRR